MSPEGRSSLELYNLIQINGGTFPTGGFSQSWGLETYVAEGRVGDAGEFREFLKNYLLSTVGKCELPVVRSAYEAETRQELERIEDISNASRTTGESRQAGLRMGKALWRLARGRLENSEEYRNGTAGFAEERDGRVSYPVLYGMLCRAMGAGIEAAMEAYVFNAANSLVQCAVKTVPLGNTEGQEMLFGLHDAMDETVETGMNTGIDEITNFCPGIDIAGFRHEDLKVRLYMT